MPKNKKRNADNDQGQSRDGQPNATQAQLRLIRDLEEERGIKHDPDAAAELTVGEASAYINDLMQQQPNKAPLKATQKQVDLIIRLQHERQGHSQDEATIAELTRYEASRLIASLLKKPRLGTPNADNPVASQA